MKIKITAPCTVRVDFQPGDTIEVSKLTPQLEALLHNERLDGAPVARLIGNQRELEKAVSVA